MNTTSLSSEPTIDLRDETCAAAASAGRGTRVSRTPSCPSWCSHDDVCTAGAFKGNWQRVAATADYCTVDGNGAHFPIVEFRAGHDVGHNRPHVWLTTATTSDGGMVALTPAEARQLAAALVATADELEGAR